MFTMDGPTSSSLKVHSGHYSLDWSGFSSDSCLGSNEGRSLICSLKRGRVLRYESIQPHASSLTVKSKSIYFFKAISGVWTLYITTFWGYKRKYIKITTISQINQIVRYDFAVSVTLYDFNPHKDLHHNFGLKYKIADYFRYFSLRVLRSTVIFIEIRPDNSNLKVIMNYKWS